jgi:hypothetical protein
MESICSPESSFGYQRHYIPEDMTLHNHRCESFKSYTHNLMPEIQDKCWKERRAAYAQFESPRIAWPNIMKSTKQCIHMCLAGKGGLLNYSQPCFDFSPTSTAWKQGFHSLLKYSSISDKAVCSIVWDALRYIIWLPKNHDRNVRRRQRKKEKSVEISLWKRELSGYWEQLKYFQW